MRPDSWCLTSTRVISSRATTNTSLQISFTAPGPPPRSAKSMAVRWSSSPAGTESCMRFNRSKTECWSHGVMEWRPKAHLSRTPPLHHSTTPFSSAKSFNSTSSQRHPKKTSTNTSATAAKARATSWACPSSITTGDITTNGLIWSYPLQKHVLSTPAIHNGLVFIADCGRMFHCLDAATGNPYWTHDIKGDAWASPLVADGKVYLGTRSGTFYVFAASKEKKVLSTTELVNPISATATAANGVLYVATMTRLYAVHQSAQRSKEVTE